MVQALIVPGLGLVPELRRLWGRGVSEQRGAYGTVYNMYELFRWFGWITQVPKRLKRKFILQTTRLGPFWRSAYAPSSAENGQVGRL